MRYLALDIETTGLDPLKHSILEVAFVEEDTLYPEVSVEDLSYTRWIIKPTDACWNDYAMDMHWHGGLLHEAKRRGLSRPQAAESILSFLRYYKDRRGIGKIVLAGKNVAGFDIPFLRNFVGAELDDLIDYRTIDPGSMFLSLGDGKPPSLSTILQHIGCHKDVAHKAVGDARDVIRCVRYFLNVERQKGKENG
jgi:oligoribonuclease